MNETQTLIIGGGAAGLMAAYGAASKGSKVVLLEKMPRPGRKIMITGKGRCNFTNVKPWEEFKLHIHPKCDFLRPAFRNLTPEALIAFFERYGMSCVVERGDRAFPESHRSSDVVDALVRAAEGAGATLRCGVSVTNILRQGETFIVNCADGSSWRCSKLIITTGGLSYPTTGSTGDGYAWASNFGHKITPRFPSLTALKPRDYVAPAESISLKNVELSSYIDGCLAQSEFGDLDFTNGGIEGPLGFRLSRKCVKALTNGSKVRLSIDLKPAVPVVELAERVAALWKEVGEDPRSKGRSFETRFLVLVGKLLPREVIPMFMRNFPRLTPEKLPSALKAWSLDIGGYVGYERCVVTAGGVNLDEVDRKTLQSRLCPGLYLAGEILDLDADTGGYNLHIAFSTGYLAGTSAST